MGRRLLTAAFSLGLSSTAMAADPASVGVESLSLVCLGAGAANKTTTTMGSIDTSDGESASAQVYSQRSVAFQDQVTLEIRGRAGRIRMPRTMLPPLRGGKDGWFEVKDVRWSENEITGTVQVNVFNSPKLRLDRLQGRIAINGKAGDYSGRCEPFDPATVQRKF